MDLYYDEIKDQFLLMVNFDFLTMHNAHNLDW